MKSLRDISTIGCVVLLASAGLLGCDNTIDPFSEGADRVFAIHGFLDSVSDSQFVRVSALRPSVLADAPSIEDISVISVDVGTGEVVLWSDSLVQLDDGSDGHLFHSAWRPVPGHTYRLEVRRGDGEAATATTVVPVAPELTAGPAHGDSLVFLQDIVFPGLTDAPQDLVMKYDIGISGNPVVNEIEIPYGRTGNLGPDGWKFEVYLKRDQGIILQKLGLPFDYKFAELRSIGVRVTIPSEEWKQQDTPVNLENAHGFFGSIGRFTLYWKLDHDAVGMIGMVDMQPGG